MECLNKLIYSPSSQAYLLRRGCYGLIKTICSGKWRRFYCYRWLHCFRKIYRRSPLCHL